ncbi:sodium:proton antiporter [Solibacillus merdavium]|uniref:Sodium:proton antiporter n=1 Tax=Solibacillus merdavium TaxID=2762218 RepID=A0ABR8XSR6_9BACL|nr:sodium:proton antiporter [Solibacillus merdavium]MBD8034962.1 sodium:proton antiporter [Solibacillus merdavium]
MNNRLIEIVTNDVGETVYKMKTFDIHVTAKLTGGIAPTITYIHEDKDVTDDIRAIRFHFENPASYIENYASFQKMLFEKEQRAVNELYEMISIKPKNMSTGKQILWSSFVFLLVMIPVFIILLIK